MKKMIEYNSSAIIKLQLKTSQRIAVQSADNLAPLLDLKFPLQESVARLMGKWIVECSRDTVLLRETDSQVREDSIVVSFQERYIDVELSCESPEGTYMEFLERVSRIEVLPRKAGLIKVEMQPEMVRPEDTILYLQKILDTSFEGMVRTAREHIDCLSDSNRATLELLEELLKEEETLTLEVNTNQAAAEAAQQKNMELKEQIEIQQQEKEAMDAEIQELRIKKEFLDLDCEAATEELEDLRMQLDLDSDTLALMEDGITLKGGTVTATLPEIGNDIKDVEKRIASIIRFRTKFNDVVEDAIFSGDGTILSSEEEMELEWEESVIEEALLENLEAPQEEEVVEEQEAEPESDEEVFTPAEPLINCDENE